MRKVESTIEEETLSISRNLRRKKIKISEVILITNKMRCKEDFKGYLTAMGFGSRQTPLSRSFS